MIGDGFGGNKDMQQRNQMHMDNMPPSFILGDSQQQIF